jgi:hypothetical protein
MMQSAQILLGTLLRTMLLLGILLVILLLGVAPAAANIGWLLLPPLLLAGPLIELIHLERLHLAPFILVLLWILSPLAVGLQTKIEPSAQRFFFRAFALLWTLYPFVKILGRAD